MCHVTLNQDLPLSLSPNACYVINVQNLEEHPQGLIAGARPFHVEFLET